MWVGPLTSTFAAGTGRDLRVREIARFGGIWNGHIPPLVLGKRPANVSKVQPMGQFGLGRRVFAGVSHRFPWKCQF